MNQLPVHCSMVSIVVLRGHRRATRMLLLRRTGRYMHGAWTYVAGHLERGETGWQAALRELREETGLRPEALYSADACESFYDPRHDCVAVVPAFVARIGAGQTVRLNGEHDASAWLSRRAAQRRLPFPGQRLLVSQVWETFVHAEPPPALRIHMPDPD